jgi:apolipoprotein N-acyltransferase
MAQAADLFGVAGLSLALVFSQSVLVQAGSALARRQPGKRWDLAVAGLLVIFLFGYGKFRISSEERAEGGRLKALLVQINIPQDAAQVLWTDLQVHEAYENETLKALEALKEPTGEKSKDWPDWVMWPESALTGRILRTKDGSWGTWQINMDTVAQVRTAGPFSLIHGAVELEGEKTGDKLQPSPTGRAYNSIAVQSPEDVLQTYRKHHLVFFGETIPFVESLPILKKIYAEIWENTNRFGRTQIAKLKIEHINCPRRDFFESIVKLIQAVGICTTNQKFNKTTHVFNIIIYR